MTAKFQHQVLYLRQLLEHVIGLDRTAGSLHRLLAARQHNGRLLAVFPEPSCNNARQRFMAVRKENDQHLIVPVLSVSQYLRLCRPMLCHILSHVVEILQLLRQLLCRLLILCQKHGKSQLCRLKPSPGIQAGADNKSNVVGRYAA